MENEIQYFSVSKVALRWGCSDDKAGRILEQYRGKSGFMDLGSGGSRRKRKYAIIRIAPSLLKEIEGELAA
jgi:hypothetical protein